MTDTRATIHPFRARSFWAAFLLGIAVIAAIDEIVFHQLLQWHHFYDGETPAIGLLTDGLLHAGELAALVAGFFLVLDAHRRGEWSPPLAGAGFLTGLGFFQLWDGTINHKVLGLHQIRYDVDVLPYDIVWVSAAAVLLVAGLAWARQLGRREVTPG
ncbi:DUF2243 domain-containing protein [Salinibacterium sp. ZJ70]|uniref:DUF2243 domain-containing protein n=1 Tax=Salinibacterium sp. ZJ70 TaxID=2708084 RepID=UPI0014226BF9|nr:DUF2243 domain-containing protein [Salinibacterium sp. ZJ70]